jgi:hypothetical protein
MDYFVLGLELIWVCILFVLCIDCFYLVFLRERVYFVLGK